jgi:hypothetical protein
MYDLSTDPMELKNLISATEFIDVRSRLRERCNEYMEQFNIEKQSP